MNTASFISKIKVTDPDTNRPVEVAIYKDRDSGAVFGVDSEFILTLSEDDPVNSPFNGEEIQLVEP